MKKLMVIFTVVAVMAAFSVGSSASTNLLTNGGFESGELAPFVEWASEASITTDAHTGSYAAAVNTLSASYLKIDATDIIQEGGDGTYLISAWAKSTGDAPSNMYFGIYHGSGWVGPTGWNGDAFIAAFDSGDWVYFEGEWEFEDVNDIFEINIQITDEKNQSYIVDDVSIVKLADAASSETSSSTDTGTSSEADDENQTPGDLGIVFPLAASIASLGGLVAIARKRK